MVVNNLYVAGKWSVDVKNHCCTHCCCDVSRTSGSFTWSYPELGHWCAKRLKVITQYKCVKCVLLISTWLLGLILVFYCWRHDLLVYSWCFISVKYRFTILSRIYGEKPNGKITQHPFIYRLPGSLLRMTGCSSPNFLYSWNSSETNCCEWLM